MVEEEKDDVITMIPSLRSRVVHSMFWLAATKAVAQVITWLITIVVVRLLTPEDYGLMGMAVLFTGFLSLFNEIGLGTAIVQKADLTTSEISDLRWVILAVNAGLFVLLLLFAPAVGAYFSEPRLVAITRTLAAGLLMNGVGIPSASILQREMAFRERSTAELAGSVAGSLSTLAMAAAGFGVWSLVLGHLVLRLVTNLLYCVHRPPVLAAPFSSSGVGKFMDFGFQVALSRLLWYVSSNADFMIVGRMLGSAQLGFYSLAFQFSSLPLQKFVTVLNSIAFPSFSSVQAETARLQRHFLMLVNAVALLTFPMFLGLLLVADSAVVVVLGAKWLPAIFPLKVLCLMSCFRAIESINAHVAIATGQPRVAVINSLLGAIVLPASFYVGARNGGIDGVALAWLVTRPFLFVGVTVLTMPVIGLTFGAYLRNLRHPVVASLVMVGTVLAVQASVARGAPPVVDLLVCIPVGCVAYFGYHVLFNPGPLREALSALPLQRLRFLRRRIQNAAEVGTGPVGTGGMSL